MERGCRSVETSIIRIFPRVNSVGVLGSLRS